MSERGRLSLHLSLPGEVNHANAAMAVAAAVRHGVAPAAAVAAMVHTDGATVAAKLLLDTIVRS